MNRNILLTTLLLLAYAKASAFCGFYIAKTKVDLLNQTSQVIMVRDGNQTVITMSNDFKGNVKDFAMVIPVPQVLRRKDIRLVQQHLFTKLNAYTAPRLVEYYDPEPNCPRNRPQPLLRRSESTERALSEDVGLSSIKFDRQHKVKVKARYSVGEYDILILSAKQSDGLEKWLISKGYKMPTGAREALEPYVKSGMKFFVVKVNLERQGKGGFASLRPLQIQFKSPKFMLPIRLGMANAEAVQDMIVYAFSKTGRVETTNYRTLKIPTNREIPYTFKTNGRFTSFYKAVFEKKWKAEGKNGVFLEYAWDLSASNPVKCDPCMAPAITHSDLAEAGVWWLKPGNMGGYSGNLHITRLHVRYSREKFPQDLAFMLTPNKQRFQGRYIVRIPARGPFNCSRAETYLKQLKVRFQKEVAELASLTGWEASGFQSYVASVPHMTTSPAPPKSPRRDIKGGPRVSPGIPSNQLPKVSDIPPMPPKAPLPNSSQPSQVQPETASPDLPAPSSQPGQSGQGTTPLPQVHDKVSAKISGNTHPKEVPGTLPISGILLTLSGLILGIAFFLKQRKPKA